MASEDIQLTFDPSVFLSNMDRITQSMENFSRQGIETFNRMNETLENMPNGARETQRQTQKTKNNTKEIALGVKKAFGGLTLLANKLKLGFDIAKKVITSIPEVAMTFKAVGDIIKKNLLWPLRKELIPVLQRLLDWTRNNRAMFVKWGGVIVNIFKSLKVLFKVVFNTLKALTKGLMDSITGLTKFASKDITQTINLLIFKLTALFLVLEAKLTPVFEFLGKELDGITNLFVDFFKSLKDIGALDAFFKILKALAKLIGKSLLITFEQFKISLKLILSLLKGFFKGMSEVEGLTEAWEGFVKAMGRALDLVLLLVRAVGDKLVPVFEFLGKILGVVVGQALKELLGLLTEMTEGIGDLFDFITKKLTTGKKTKKVKDAIIRPDGSVIETDPKDTLVALKNPMQSMNQVSNNVNNTANIRDVNVNLNVTEGNAEQTGRNFANGFTKGVRQDLMDSLVLGGER